MIRLIFRRVFSARGFVVLFALVFGVGAGFGVSAWKAEPAEAIEGGTEATELGGQVQIRKGIGTEKGSTTICSGTLISPTWVLTAKHCVESKYASLREKTGRVLVGDTQRGEGHAYKIKSMKEQHPDADVALIELQKPASEEYVVGYSGINPAKGDEFQVRGWGPLKQGNYSWSKFTDGIITNAAKTLQEYTARVEDIMISPWMEDGERIEIHGLNGAGARPGDSGAGWYADGSIHAVLAGGSSREERAKGKRDVDFGVPTSDVADWIAGKTDVQPRCSAAQHFHTPREAAGGEGSDGRPRYRGSGRGAGGAAAGEALAELAIGKDTADEDAKKLVKRLREQYPQCNVIVIQKETYGGPENIEGVVENWKTSLGDNSWDVWVFRSGTFINDGDLGYNNWVFAGNYERSGPEDRITTFKAY